MNLKYCGWLLLAFLIFGLCCNPLALYFLSDDFDSIFSALHWSGVTHSYRPGSDFLLHTDHLLYGYQAGYYHITNYLLHFATSLALFFTTQQLLLPFYSKTATGKLAFTASLVFLFYPFHSECIFWLVGRSSLLATLFAMASIYFYIRKKENRWLYALSLLCLMLGLFSYESIWTLPVIIIIISFVYDKIFSNKQKFLYIIGYWLTFFSYLVARFYLTTTVIGSPYGTQKILSFNLFFLLRNGTALISRSFVPPIQSPVMFVLCLGIVAVLLLFVFIKIRKHIDTPLVVAGIAYLLCLLPVISLGIDTHDTESERFLYMPSAFLSLLMTVVFFVLFKNKTVYALTLLLAVQLYFLEISYQSFAAASKVTKASVEAIQALQQTHSVYCIDIPEQYKGGFIFRNGFASAVHLFAPQVKAVVINPHKELFIKPAVYTLRLYALKALVLPKNKSGITQKISANAAVFIWTDSTLNVYQ